MEYLSGEADSLWGELDLGNLLSGKVPSYKESISIMPTDDSNLAKVTYYNTDVWFPVIYFSSNRI